MVAAVAPRGPKQTSRGMVANSAPTGLSREDHPKKVITAPNGPKKVHLNQHHLGNQRVSREDVHPCAKGPTRCHPRWWPSGAPSGSTSYINQHGRLHSTRRTATTPTEAAVTTVSKRPAKMLKWRGRTQRRRGAGRIRPRKPAGVSYSRTPPAEAQAPARRRSARSGNRGPGSRPRAPRPLPRSPQTPRPAWEALVSVPTSGC